MKPLKKTMPLLAVLLLAGIASAQPGMAGGGHRPGGRGMETAALPGGGDVLQRMLPVLRQLDLTDAQQQEIRNIVEGAREEVMALRDPQSHGGLREQFIELLVSSSITSSQVESILNARLETMRLVNTVIAAAVVEIHGVLTPEQRSALAEMDMHHH
jgi:Spy/CpxP family protein refolding chaperone